jgi:hypothetical protein
VQTLQNQRDEAFARHQTAQDALMRTLRNTRVEALTREIKDKEIRLSVLYRGGLLGSGDSAKADPSKPSVSDSGLEDYRIVEVRTINDLAQTLRRLDVTRARMQALANQPDFDASDAWAVALVKAQLVAISDALPSQVQFQLPGGSAADVRTNVTQLTTSIDRARILVAQEFEARQANYETQRATEIRQLEAELRPMHAELDGLLTGQRQQTLERDLAWDTYSALARKLEERKVAQTSGGHEVEIASKAWDARPVPRSSTLNLVLGALAGLTTVSLALLIRTSIAKGTLLPRPAARNPLPAS